MKVIIDNSSWFEVYYKIRQVILLVLLLLIVFFIIFSGENTYLFSYFYWPFLFVLILFELIQKPGLLQMKKSDTKIELLIFIPDYRYYFSYNKNNIIPIVIPKGNRVFIKIENKYIYFKKIYFIVNLRGKMICTKKIDFSWSSTEELNKLYTEIIDFNES